MPSYQQLLWLTVLSILFPSQGASFVEFLAPQQDELVAANSIYVVKWATSSSTGRGTMVLLSGETVDSISELREIGYSIDVATGNFSWSVGSPTRGALLSNFYSLNFSRDGNESTFDISPPFRILSNNDGDDVSNMDTSGKGTGNDGAGDKSGDRQTPRFFSSVASTDDDSNAGDFIRGLHDRGTAGHSARDHDTEHDAEQAERDAERAERDAERAERAAERAADRADHAADRAADRARDDDDDDDDDKGDSPRGSVISGMSSTYSLTSLSTGTIVPTQLIPVPGSSYGNHGTPNESDSGSSSRNTVLASPSSASTRGLSNGMIIGIITGSVLSLLAIIGIVVWLSHALLYRRISLRKKKPSGCGSHRMSEIDGKYRKAELDAEGPEIQVLRLYELDATRDIQEADGREKPVELDSTMVTPKPAIDAKRDTVGMDNAEGSVSNPKKGDIVTDWAYY